MTIPYRVPLHAGFEEEQVVDYLALLWPDVSRRALTEAFARGLVRSGGMPTGMKRRLGDLDDLVFHGDPADLARIPHVLPEGARESVEVLHEDERLAVLAKPSGVPVVPDRARGGDSCLGFLIRRELAARPTKPPARWVRYRIVHRLDRLTSGLVIVARDAETERRLGVEFEARRVEKEYRVLVRREVLPAVITVCCPIRPGRKGRMRAEPGPDAKDAETRFEVIERFAPRGDTHDESTGATLLRALPRTGRTHQIRVHAWAMGHPLLVDPLYGAERSPRGGSCADVGLTLHAARYALPPGWNEPRAFSAPVPASWCGLLASLRGD